MGKKKDSLKDRQKSIKDLKSYTDTLRDASFLFEEKVEELSLLRRVGNILSYIFDLESFYQKFVDILMEETNADNCSFMLMDTDTNRLVLKMARGRNDDGTFFEHPRESKLTFSPGEGVAGKVASERETILVDDASEDKRFETRKTRFSIGSLLCTPLIFQEKVLGVINLSKSQPHAFTQNIKRVIELLCAFVSSIIGNANDYIKVKDQEKLRAMIEGLRLSILLIDPKTSKIIDCNRHTEEWLGYGKKELIDKKNVFNMLPPEYREKADQILHGIIEKNSPEFYEISVLKKDGKATMGEINGTMISYQGRNVVQLSIKDISERIKAEEALKKSEEKYHSLIENANDAILIVDNQGNIISWNRAAETIFGYNADEIMGKSISLLIPERFAENNKKEFIKAASAREPANFGRTVEYAGIRKDGSEFPVEVSYSSWETKGEIYYTAIVRDISERKEIEYKLLQSEKLMSLGELAGGVAHDFNNVLAAILGRVQLLRMHIKNPPGLQEKRKSVFELRKSLKVIESAAIDGAETVRRIQEFSRKRSDDKYFTQVDINKLIDDVLEYTKVRWKNEAESKGIKIKIKKDFSSLPSIAGSTSELREIFTNIINNAIDAMPQGGQIKIKTLKEDSHISIKIKDTGSGILKDIKDRIFDPFFTTKGVQSTGLGLSVSYGVINRHRGNITVDSMKGKGATFTIKLPLFEKTTKKEKAKPISGKRKKVEILVIEDEENVRELLTDILTDEGHKVETSSNGKQGVEIFKKKGFDLVFTDLGMPEMSGWQVAQEIKKVKNNTPVALITGWDVQLKDSELKKSGLDLVIKKPFRVDHVLGLVQKCMELREKAKKKANKITKDVRKKKSSMQRIRNKGRR